MFRQFWANDIPWRPFELVVGAVVASCVLQILYSLYLHPLANVPGPFLCKISSLPSFYHAWVGDRHIWIWQLFHAHADNSAGDHIRCQPNTVLWNSPAAYRSIYSVGANVQKSRTYTAWLSNKHDTNTFLTIDFARHAKKRTILNRAFKHLTRATDTAIVKHVDRWNELLNDNTNGDWSPPRDMSSLIDSLCYDILGDLCLGKSFEIKEPAANPLEFVPHAIAKYMHLMYMITKLPCLDFLVWLKSSGLHRLLSMIVPSRIQKYRLFVEEHVQERLRLQRIQRRGYEQQHDIFHFLCEAKDPETGEYSYTEDDLLSEVNLLIIAGSDTTATCLCGIFFYLTRYPRPYNRLVCEIRSTFKSVNDITRGSRLKSCKYLQACISEGMRMTPVAPSEMPREVRAGGMEVDGQQIAAGVNIGTSSWAASRNKEVYGDPHIFRPERWIPDECAFEVTNENVARLHQNFNPFSHGPTSCVGKDLALLEIMVTIGRTLYRFDVRKAPGSTLGEGNPGWGWGRQDPMQYQLKDGLIALRHGPMAEFRRRAAD